MATSGRDTAAIEAWEALLRVRASLVPMLSDEVEARSGLSLAEYDVLLELNRAGGPLRVTELGRRVVLSRTRVSRVVSSMERTGLLARSPDAGDGRATLVEPTAAGRAAFRRAAPVYLAGIRSHFATALDDGEAQRITSALHRVLAAAEGD